ncbi:MAG: hypothetical protein QM811_28095 [Pirellulales bacterium]
MLRPIFRMLFVLLSLGMVAQAEDFAYYRMSLADLKITAGKFQDGEHDDYRPWTSNRPGAMSPYIVLDGAGEAYMPLDSLVNWNEVGPLVVQAPAGKDVSGTCYFPKRDLTGMTPVRFVISKDAAKAEYRDDFYRRKADYYRLLMNRQIPGGAWFRYQVKIAQRETGRTSETVTNIPWTAARDFDDTFDLFTGGRAIGENLQLDRAFTVAVPNQKSVDVSTIKGITVQEIDWKPLLKEKTPKLDSLADVIPADQHAVFFPTFDALIRLTDEAEKHGTPVLRLAEPKAEDARTVQRYQTQLCMSLGGVGRIVGPTVVKSVALTGSDLNFRTGTDVAVIFEAADAAALEQLLLAKINLTLLGATDVERSQGTIEGLAYQGFKTPDRRVSCYIARLPNAVVVTNSPAQLRRLGETQKQTSPSIASLSEFKFFRDRYRHGDESETAFAFLSDAAIRRWCGPRWRIASSRQMRQVAVMTDLEAVYMGKIVSGKIQAGPIYTEVNTGLLDDLTLTAAGVHSPKAGSLEFLTPIAETPLTTVTQGEADAYMRWRDGYQANWSWAFDPIGIRFTVRDDRLAADVTVMPLIGGTEYRRMIEISSGAEIAPGAGDPHDALLHIAMSLNAKSHWIRQGGNLLASAFPGLKVDPLGWLGSSIAVYADDDPIWEELAKKDPTRLQNEFAILPKLPIALSCEVADPLKATLFLAALRAYIEQTAPGMTQWEAIKQGDLSYVKISPTASARGMAPRKAQDIAVYYVISGKQLTFSLHEKTIQNSLRRQAERDKKATAEVDGAKTPQHEWLGKNFSVDVDRKFLDFAALLSSRQQQNDLQVLAWGNIPILNEWRRLYPTRDPVEIHRLAWKTELVCPGGGKYVWNEKWGTYESTIYGHPGDPKDGPIVTPGMLGIERAAFGLTFEDQGLRAKAEIRRNAK